MQLLDTMKLKEVVMTPSPMSRREINDEIEEPLPHLLERHPCRYAHSPRGLASERISEACRRPGCTITGLTRTAT